MRHRRYSDCADGVAQVTMNRSKRANSVVTVSAEPLSENSSGAALAGPIRMVPRGHFAATGKKFCAASTQGDARQRRRQSPETNYRDALKWRVFSRRTPCRCDFGCWCRGRRVAPGWASAGRLAAICVLAFDRPASLFEVKLGIILRDSALVLTAMGARASAPPYS